MIKSPLLSFALRRRDSLEFFDKSFYKEEDLPGILADLPPCPSFVASLRPANKSAMPKVLAEVKKASPSLGPVSNLPATEIAARFLRVRIPAISVLADPVHFAGSVGDVRDVAKLSPNTPVLYKDFVSTEYQVRCARAAGASSVLLMTQLLETGELQDLYGLAKEIGLEPFVETHTPEEFARALAIHPPAIGVNSRDFHSEDMPVDLNTLPELLRSEYFSFPEDSILIAQSGINSLDSVMKLIKACPDGLPHSVQIGAGLSGGRELPDWFREYLSK